MHMHSIDDIPSIPDQSQRIAEVTVDCYGQAEELVAFEVYFTDAIAFPFSATWRDPDEPDHAEGVTVLGVDSVDERRGILLRVQRGDKQRACWLSRSGRTTPPAPTPPCSTITGIGSRRCTG